MLEIRELFCAWRLLRFHGRVASDRGCGYLIAVDRLAGFTPTKLAVGKGLHVVYRLELRYSTSGMRLSGSGWEDFTVSNAKLLCISLTPAIWRSFFSTNSEY
jgi:hypothetical protein